MSTISAVASDSKRVFEEVADLSRKHQIEYRFEQAESANGMIRKYFYFGDKLVGVGDDQTSARQAKLKAAQQGVVNIKDGKTVQMHFPKNGKSFKFNKLTLSDDIGLMESLKNGMLTDTQALNEIVEERE